MLETALVRRLRDQLLAQVTPSPPSGEGESPPELGDYSRAALQRVTPLAELLFLVLAADGQSDERERRVLRGAILTLTDGLIPESRAEGLLEGFRTAFEKEGMEARLEAVTGRLAADREDAEVGVLLVAAVALADGRIAPEEQALFDQVIERLGVSKSRLAELLGDGSATSP